MKGKPDTRKQLSGVIIEASDVLAGRKYADKGTASVITKLSDYGKHS